MKCPVCGAWSEVIETREAPLETVRRRRTCANGHRFTTLEVHPATVDKTHLSATQRRVQRTRALYARDQVIRADNRKHHLIAADYGLRREQISNIKRRSP